MVHFTPRPENKGVWRLEILFQDQEERKSLKRWCWQNNFGQKSNATFHHTIQYIKVTILKKLVSFY